MLASDQSDWFLDDLVPATWRAHLPALYGAILVVGRATYRLLGPQGVQRVDSALGLTYYGHHYGQQIAVHLPVAVVALLVAAQAVRRLQGPASGRSCQQAAAARPPRSQAAVRQRPRLRAT